MTCRWFSQPRPNEVAIHSQATQKEKKEKMTFDLDGFSRSLLHNFRASTAPIKMSKKTATNVQCLSSALKQQSGPHIHNKKRGELPTDRDRIVIKRDEKLTK